MLNNFNEVLTLCDQIAYGNYWVEIILKDFVVTYSYKKQTLLIKSGLLIYLEQIIFFKKEPKRLLHVNFWFVSCHLSKKFVCPNLPQIVKVNSCDKSNAKLRLIYKRKTLDNF